MKNVGNPAGRLVEAMVASMGGEIAVSGGRENGGLGYRQGMIRGKCASGVMMMENEKAK